MRSRTAERSCKAGSSGKWTAVTETSMLCLGNFTSSFGRLARRPECSIPYRFFFVFSQDAIRYLSLYTYIHGCVGRAVSPRRLIQALIFIPLFLPHALSLALSPSHPPPAPPSSLSSPLSLHLSRPPCPSLRLLNASSAPCPSPGMSAD